MTAPNKILEQMRQAIRAWESAEAGSRAETEAAERATSAAAALDYGALRGDLPGEWMPKPDSRDALETELDNLTGTNAELVRNINEARSQARYFENQAADLRNSLQETAQAYLRLKELADVRYDGGLVLRCMERDADSMMRDATTEAAGTFIRATDTGAEWIKRPDGGWTGPWRPWELIPVIPEPAGFTVGAGSGAGGTLADGFIVMGGGGSGDGSPHGASAGGPPAATDGRGGGGGTTGLRFRAAARGGIGQNGDGSWGTDGHGCPVCGAYGQGSSHGNGAGGSPGCPNRGHAYAYDGARVS
jgi:hypothetical protein